MSRSSNTVPVLAFMAAQGRSVTIAEIRAATGLGDAEARRGVAALMDRVKAQRDGSGLPARYALTDVGRESAGVAPSAEAAEMVSTELVKLAMAAVRRLGQETHSSYALASALDCPVSLLDKVLAPLVDARRLQRFHVVRSAIPMFDYRLFATWAPVPDDFTACGAPGPTPVAPTIAVQPPAPAALKPGAPGWMATTSARKAPSALPVREMPASAPAEASPAPSAAPVAEPTTPPAVELSDVARAGLEQLTKDVRAAEAFGWSMASMPTDEDAAHAAVMAEALEDATAPGAREATDLVCAVNTRGEMAIDLGGGDIVKLPPSRAAALRQFLIGCAFLDRFLGVAA